MSRFGNAGGESNSMKELVKWYKEMVSWSRAGGANELCVFRARRGAKALVANPRRSAAYTFGYNHRS